MGKTYEFLTPELQAWLRQQRVFFVATAPLSGAGHVNCSPKGGDTFRILGPRQVAYQDLTGSGIETAAHVRENGRIVLMFCAFEGPPRIVRLHGRGKVIEPDHAEFASLVPLFPPQMGTRALIHVDIDRIADSCGYAVPLYSFVAQRDVLQKWAIGKGSEGLAAFRGKNNRVSVDGIPGLRTAELGIINDAPSTNV